MENTEKLLLDDQNPSWYLAKGSGWVGPLTAKEIFEKIRSQEISWAHYAWKPGEKSWRRLCDIDVFTSAIPEPPSKEIIREVKKAAADTVAEPPKKAAPSKGPPEFKRGASDEDAEVGAEQGWYLYYNETQFGPFSVSEVRRFLNLGKIHGRVHAWCEGMPNWERLSRIDTFQDWVPQGSAPKPKPKPKPKSAPEAPKAVPQAVEDKRSTPRQPLVARLLMSNESTVFVGMCRDISVGGMQVLSDRVPGKVGERIKLNVSPTRPKGAAGKTGAKKTLGLLEPFVAEGVIVRVLEDGRGFSFRFQKISESAKKAIQRYAETESSE